ncbi:hypothetical protein PROFUN_02904 [Planoprotostelium fungivorum]|uniref:Uncharacterized protein n=1 Tax=Planoprotostelium fungivorum TaxID=1890364 RepID=A0A2P6NS17_9EUKA|nr:hypothetical protein PROFUN_02904 [Planoprotostelium fungivorum]
MTMVALWPSCPEISCVREVLSSEEPFLNASVGMGSASSTFAYGYDLELLRMLLIGVPIDVGNMMATLSSTDAFELNLNGVALCRRLSAAILLKLTDSNDTSVYVKRSLSVHEGRSETFTLLSLPSALSCACLLRSVRYA